MSTSVSSKVGRLASMVVSVATVVFAVALIWELGSPSNIPKYLGYVASMLIAVGVVVLMTSFYLGVDRNRSVFGMLALVAAVIYAPLCIGVYFLQLSIVALNPLDLSNDVLAAIDFKPGSPAFAMDMLGYGCLCLSTLAAAFALSTAKDRLLKALCFFHGVLVIPTLAAPIVSGAFLSASGETDSTGNYVLLFWCAVFVPIALLFMRHFKAGQMADGNVARQPAPDPT